MRIVGAVRTCGAAHLSAICRRFGTSEFVTFANAEAFEIQVEIRDSLQTVISTNVVSLHSRGEMCAVPHDRNRVVIAGRECLSVLNLVTNSVTAFDGGGIAPAIHHNSTSKYAGRLYLWNHACMLERVDFIRCEDGETVRLERIPYPATQHADSCEHVSGMVFDKSSPDSSVLYMCNHRIHALDLALEPSTSACSARASR